MAYKQLDNVLQLLSPDSKLQWDKLQYYCSEENIAWSK